LIKKPFYFLKRGIKLKSHYDNQKNMEQIIFQIYGTFILTLASFVLPIITIAISIFSEGAELLRQSYKNKQEQAEVNLKNEIDKKESGKEMDCKILEENIKKLKSIKNISKRRLLYLDPTSILLRSAAAVLLSFSSFLLGLAFFNQFLYVTIISFFVSIITFAWLFIIFSNAIQIIIEASSAVKKIQKDTENKKLELLTIIADNSKEGDSRLFINEKDIKLYFDKKEITNNEVYRFSVNKKYSIEIWLKNLSQYMLKKAEHGFYLPTQLLIEGKAISSVYTDESEKQRVVRFKSEYIHNHENLNEGSVDITFLKAGTFDVETFAKGENLRVKRIKFKIEVIE